MSRSLVLGLFLFMSLTATAGAFESVEVPEALRGAIKSFEASSVVYLPEDDLYLVSSDDTTKEDEALLFWMKDNAVFPEPAKVLGVSKMTDIESISRDGDEFYFLSSMGVNKSNKSQVQRNLLVSAKREGMNFRALKQVDLRRKILDGLSGMEFRFAGGNLEELLDVESHFFLNGDFYVGLKAPLTVDAKSVILRLGSASDIFSKNLLKIEIWREISFQMVSMEADHLSEIRIFDNVLWLTTTQESGIGRFWKYDLQSQGLELQAEFSRYHPEGLDWDSQKKQFVLVFDEKSKGSFVHFY